MDNPYLENNANFTLQVSRKYLNRRTLIFFVVLLFLFLASVIFLNMFFKNNIRLGGRYCEPRKGNLCEGKIVELKGKIKEPTFLPGYGYRFIPQDTSIQNEIYVSATRYDGYKLGGGPESFVPKVPFGSEITVKGYVVIKDSHRCIDKNYAAENAKYCDINAFRIQVNPSSIISEANQGQSRTYTIFGKFKDFSVVAACKSSTMLCEDNLGLINDSCVEVELNRNYCSQLKEQPNMFLISGRTKSFNETLHPESVVQVNSIGYQNQSLDTVTGYNKYFLNSGVYAVYNKTGEKIAQINPGTKDYFEIDNLILASQGIYYFVRNELYFASKDANQPQKIGTMPSEFFGKEPNFSQFRLANNNKEIFFVSHKNNSYREVEGNRYYSNTIFLLKIPLNLSKSNEIITPDVLYQETIEGSVNVIGYNPEANSAIVSYTYDNDLQPCRKEQYESIDLTKQIKTPLFSSVIDGNKYCTQTIYKSLYNSDDGSTILFGLDFNNFTQGEKPNRLILYSISSGKASNKEYLAQGSLLRNPNIQIISIGQKNMTVVDPTSDNIQYTFPLIKEEYSKENFESVARISTESAAFANWTSNRYQLSNARYLYFDNNKWYFLVWTGLENKLYIVDNKTREVFLAATFSPLARVHYLNKEPLIIDTDH